MLPGYGIEEGDGESLSAGLLPRQRSLVFKNPFTL